ncbi:MAG: MBL fold metallo-hydrolase [Fimbriimonadaceae bacterium]|nr:MBL fold metallo-hydrolase [Chitinophagales bacterium]
MKLISINSGLFKLDGGAMFGVVPKKIWSKLITPDTNNLCTWSMRCLLVDAGYRKILIDCGMGNKQDEKFFSHYEPHGEQLFESLNKNGYASEDITDVFLTHLHFDHCGGAVAKTGDGKFIPAFPNAAYWSNKKQWDWATNPNSREKASFLKENFIPLLEQGVLKFIKDETEEIIPGFKTIWVNGHTESMMLPVIQYNSKTIVYMADLMPSYAHIPIPYVMGYDVRPLITLKEKEEFLKEAVEKNYILFFEHDAEHECCDLQMTDKGIRPKDFFTIDSI